MVCVQAGRQRQNARRIKFIRLGEGVGWDKGWDKEQGRGLESHLLTG